MPSTVQLAHDNTCCTAAAAVQLSTVLASNSAAVDSVQHIAVKDALATARCASSATLELIQQNGLPLHIVAFSIVSCDFSDL
eukprot:10200-Heterococcus_DN1.PRE.1